MIQIYTGDGKGKTTAAVGQAVRAAGAGYRVTLIQFFKNGTSSETEPLKKLGIRIFHDNSSKFYKDMTPKEQLAVGMTQMTLYDIAAHALMYGHADMLILDEFFSAVMLGTIPLNDALDLVEMAGDKDLILTGRTDRLTLDLFRYKADCITVMTPEKHHFDKGAKARKGIEY